MIVKVYVERENKEKIIKINKGNSVKQVLEHLKINPTTVIVSKNNEIVVEDEEVKDGDFLNVISVISGG
jgi:sulfur carrier protein